MRACCKSLSALAQCNSGRSIATRQEDKRTDSRQRYRILLALALFVVVLGFGHAQTNPSKEYIRLGSRVIAIENPNVQVAVSPASQSVNAWQTALFSATVSGSNTTSVQWTINPTVGQISAGGLYTPPNPIAAAQAITVTATSSNDSAAVGTAVVNLIPVALSVSPAGPLTVAAGQIVQFTPSVTGASNTGVSWTISPSGVGTFTSSTTGATYTAPTVVNPQQTSVNITGTSQADTTRTTTIAITLTPNSALAFNPLSATASAGGGTGTVNVVSNLSTTAWQVSSDATWLTAMPASGTGNATLTYSASSTCSARTGHLTLSSVGLTPPLSSTFTVSQIAATSSLIMTPTSGSYSSHASGGTIVVTSACPWSATSSNSWITIGTGSGVGSSTGEPVTFILQPNNSSVVRSGSITIAPSGGAPLIFAITQDIVRSISLAPNSATVIAGSSITFTAYLDGIPDNSGASWVVNSGAYGSVSQAGVYTLPSNIPSGFPTDTVTARALGNSALTATASIILTPQQQTPPEPTFLTPQAGLGTGGTFSLGFTDAAGFNQISNLNLRFGSVIQQNESVQCFAQIFPSSPSAAMVELYPYALGYIPYNPSTGPATLSTSYCTMAVASTSMTGVTSTDMTANFALTFLNAFAGTRNAYVSAQGKGYTSGWPEVQMASYTVVGSPSVVSPAAPPSGSGSSPTFVVQYSDPAGVNNLQRTELLVTNSTGAHANACYVKYVSAQNALYLRDDADGQWLGGFTPNSSVTVENSQCKVAGPGSAASPNGNSLSLTVPLVFKSAFAASGTVKFVYGMAMDNNNVGSGYPQVASWTLTPIGVSITPSATSLNAGQNVTLSASVNNTTNAGVNWSISPLIGSITPQGLYTAPTSIPSQQTVTITATSQADLTASGSATITLVPVTVTLSPAAVTLSSGQARAFTAGIAGTGNSTLNWTIAQNVGSLVSASTTSGSNTYTAPASVTSQQTVTLTVVSPVDPASATTATITLTPIGVGVSPSSVTLNANGTQRFSAYVTGSTNTNVSWSLSPLVGTVDATGLYKAPASVTSQQTITVIATSQADLTVTSTATVVLSPVSVSVVPTAASLNSGQTLQFSATVTGGTSNAVTWTVAPAIGTITSAGLYAAPAVVSSVQTITITATSVSDASRSAVATITLYPAAVSVSPATVSLYSSQTQQFSATVSGSSNTAVTWSINVAVGAISSSGLYTAPASITSQQTVTVIATSAADSTKRGTATVTLIPPASGYSYHRALTILHAKVPNSDQTNFPILFNSADPALKSVGNSGHVSNANGYDIIFTSDPAGTQKLDHELESYNPATGTFIAWVRVPTLSHTNDTTIYLFYGNGSINSSQENKPGVWDGNFKGVWHLPNGTTIGALDSSANANNGTVVGVTPDAGRVAGGGSFNGSAYIDLGTVNNSVTSPLTVEGWVNLSAAASGQHILSAGNNGSITQWELTTDASSHILWDTWNGGLIGATGGVLSLGSWYHIVGTHDGTTWRLYVNGSPAATSTAAGPTSIGRKLEIGSVDINGSPGQFLTGKLDEIRLSNIARSGDWIATEYANVNDPASFYSVGTESGGGIPASITATGGTPQSTTVATAFATALQATVKDASGNPVSGVTVTFTVPSSGASATFGGSTTAVTNSSGQAIASALTANSTAGSYTVTASVAGVSTPASFSLTNTSAAGGTDLALNKTATQSSTYNGNTAASKAVDGNTDGNFNDGSVSHTNADANAWWQVDLGSSATISSITIWNRTDCCSDRLSDYWVFVSNTPFLSTDTPTTLQGRAGTWSSHQTSYPNPSVTIAVNAQGQYVRVQLTGSNYLALAEVQVYGH